MRDLFLFLDIDGVCNSLNWSLKHEDREDKSVMLERALIGRVNQIVEKSGCQVILSSTWRLGEKLTCPRTQSLLARFGATFKIQDRTPNLPGKERGLEIQSWLDEHSVKAEQIVILDDDSDMLHLLPRLVKTSWQTGVQEEHVQQALALFGVQK